MKIIFSFTRNDFLPIGFKNKTQSVRLERFMDLSLEDHLYA